ncbi:MAG TPA: DUF4091 domain-containing protein [Vicinamibacterales bacterium]|nr:DUF4091 domain-containing protein [Acidobacteriota bacterium]HOC18412.1 DUF4091 domain-containing protein [Vicinamibacterales bacterium]
MTTRLARLGCLVSLILAVTPVASPAGVKRVWAVNDTEKIARENLSSPLAAGNSAWDGRSVKLFGARNEVLAVQVIVEADERGIASLSLRLPELKQRGGTARFAYVPPGADPTDSVGRPIQLFALNYMHVPGPATAHWIYRAGTESAARGMGWQPVQIVPENARSGRGGFPLGVPPSSNQAFWIEIYTGKERPAGIYEGAIEIVADGRTIRLPIELELFGFALPDENSLNLMVYFEGSQPERYMGRNFDAEFHRFAHRHRVELVHAYDEAALRQAFARFTGAAFTPAERYEGPGETVGHRFAPATFYGPGRAFESRESARSRSDAWMTFLEKTLPGAITFLYLPDEPGPAQYPRLRELADYVHSNPGPGRRLKTFATKEYVPELDGAVDIWCAPPQTYDIARARSERAKGREYWTYNGSRPFLGVPSIEAPAADPRSMAWAAFKENIPTFFYWHGVHWFHNSQKQGDRRQNVWANPVTFDNRGQPGKEDTGFAYGDGVLIYPGLEVVHPEEDRGIAGPVSTVQLANYRRGLQDHLYLTLARKAGLGDLVDEALRAIVPRVFSEADAKSKVGWAEAGDAYEAMRLKIGRALAAK